MATRATGLPATALTGLDLRQLDSNKRFRKFFLVPLFRAFPARAATSLPPITAPIASGCSDSRVGLSPMQEVERRHSEMLLETLTSTVIPTSRATRRVCYDPAAVSKAKMQHTAYCSHDQLSTTCEA
jgi:hypothetical protein